MESCLLSSEDFDSQNVPSTNIICLLDDEPSVLKALGRLLLSEGLETEKFTKPACFLAYAQTHSVRLAVIDVRMPDMNGLEVQAALRSFSPETRAIIITAEDDLPNRATAMAGGASAFFLKPLEADAFIEAVRAALASAE